MISLRGFYIAILALVVWEVDNVRAARTWISPVSFSYKSDDTIFVNIILQNVPVEADRYIVHYQTEPAKSYTIPTDRTITIMRPLNSASLIIHIVLRNGNKRCATKRIMDGVRDDNADGNQFSKECLNEYGNLCDIIADFGNQCEGLTRQTPAVTPIDCLLYEGRLTCEVVGEVIPEDTVHQWYQAYSNGSLIGTIPAVKGSKTEFKMTMHKFDINTQLQHTTSTMKSAHFDELLLLPTNGYKNYHVEHIKKCTENELISFNCSNNAHTQIGVIEPTGNRITTDNKTTFLFNLTKEGNGSMICCLNYLIYTAGNKTIVERTVTDITKLIYYEERVIQDNVKGLTESSVMNNTSNDEPPVPRTETGDAPVQINKPKDKSSVINGVLTGLAVVMGVAIIVGCVVILHMKKCCRVKSTSKEPPQTLIPRNPFYVNLLFRKECQEEIYAAEHIYEEIN